MCPQNAIRLGLTFLLSLVSAPLFGQAETPSKFFGFELGTDGEMARYPKVLEYLQHLAETSDRLSYEKLGDTTEGNDYVLARISSPENLGRFDRLVEINRRLADPRGLSEREAKALSEEGRPFYFLYATIHSTEVGNGQSIPVIAHRLATESSAEIQEILDNAVVLVVPSQNPDGQIMVIDHWYQTKGTRFSRVFPDLYHKYTGHDDNRDWFMFTQIETRLNIEKVQNRLKPTVTHDMHQMGSYGARIFVPPFQDPYDRNMHPILMQGQARIGIAMANELIASGKSGVAYNQQYDLWAPARQYMVYHGQPRILTEIASVRIADPLTHPLGEPLGPQQIRSNYPRPYRDSDWSLAQIMEYGQIAVFAALKNMAKYREDWLFNFYRVHRDWVERDEAPYAFVIPASQRDPDATFRLLELLDFADVEIHRARQDFQMGGRSFASGSWVVQLAQPYGAFAKTMLEIQEYPDLRYYPGGPPIPPYDVTGHTLGFLMGVEVLPSNEPVKADLSKVETLSREPSVIDDRAGWAYVLPAENNASHRAVASLNEAGVPIYRTAEAFTAATHEYSPGSFLVRPSTDARRILRSVSETASLSVSSIDEAPSVSAHRLKEGTRVGLYKSANNMPAGWMMWLFEQYGVNHRVMSSQDFAGDLSRLYDVIVLPAGTTKDRMIEGLSSDEHDERWRWAYGIGQDGWRELERWVRDGGTLVALGNATLTARDLLSLPIDPVLPTVRRRRRSPMPAPDRSERITENVANQRFKDSFQSPASLLKAIEHRVVDPTSVFFCPGSLLKQRFDNTHPVGYGMPERWPVFFRFDQAYRLKPSFDVSAEVVSHYPSEEEMVESGWLLGGELLRDQANVMAFRVDRGYVVTMGSQIAFRNQTPATFKLLFNAIWHGPSQKVEANELANWR